LQHTLPWVSRETSYPDIFSADFHSGSVVRNKKIDQVYVEGPAEKMLAVPNRLQKLNGCSCSSQL